MGNQNAAAPGVGTHGGSCTCPGSGTQYWVGDNNDNCKSLACVGGTSGKCNEYKDNKWAGRKVTCGIATSEPVNNTPPAPLDACPAGWTWGLNRCWKVLPETKGWDAGKTTCEAEGGGSTLAKISTEAENRFVAELGVAQGESRPLLWLGAKETGTTMKYTWVDGAKTGAPLYTAWLQNQPNRDDMGHAPTLPECLIVGYQKTTETYNKALDTGWISSDCRTSYYSTRVPTLPF